MANPIIDQITLSGVTHDIVDNSAVHSLDGYYTTAQTDAAITAATEALATTIANQHYQTSADTKDFFDGAEYDSNSKRINFKHGSTVKAYIDATAFIKDGMVDKVEIKDVTISGQSVSCLVISFNTDAGKEDINIPLTEIFDADNYVTVNTFNTHSGNTNMHLDATEKTNIDALATNIGAISGITSSDVTAWNAKSNLSVSVQGTTLVFA